MSVCVFFVMLMFTIVKADAVEFCRWLRYCRPYVGMQIEIFVAPLLVFASWHVPSASADNPTDGVLMSVTMFRFVSAGGW